MSLRKYEFKYDECIRSKDIITNGAEKAKVSSYMERARSDLLLAKLLMKISQDEKAKQALIIDPAYSCFHWVIVSAYYAMYHAATAAIANKNIKARNHVATIAALAKHYATGSELARHLEEIHIIHLDATRTTRATAQYNVTKSFSQKEAERTLETAQDFIDNIDEIL